MKDDVREEGGRQNQRGGHSQKCLEPPASGPALASGILKKKAARGLALLRHRAL